ncbi:MAG: Trk system potassium transporter TrkA [Sphingomonadales bacterium]|nr:Trk system potassium transporter TrkA [Sphingomonadales bacterium]
MKVIVCGAGQVGFSIAKHMAAQQIDITVIDRSPELIRKISESLDVQALEGFASDPDLLDRANAADADMLIAVAASDEVNMVACQVAHSLFNVPKKIARIRNRSYLRPAWQDLFSRDHLPIDLIISPEVEVAEAISRRIDIPGAFDVIPFAERRIRVVGVLLDEDCPIVETPLRQLTELFPDLNIFVLGIVREGRTFAPSPEDHMQVGDGVYFAVEESHTGRAMTVFGHEEPEARRIIIVGGGHVGTVLARNLEAHDPPVNIKVIEADTTQAEWAAENLKRSVVINGDALDGEILREAGVHEAETLVAVSSDDEVNILSSLLAKRQGCGRTITLVYKQAYRPLLGSLGIDVPVDPREATVSRILQHVRRGRIRALHSLRDGAAEIIEAEILETSPMVGKALREVNLPDGVLVGAIARGDEIIIPRGDTKFEAHDRVVVFVLAQAVKKIEQLFAVRLEFF